MIFCSNLWRPSNPFYYFRANDSKMAKNNIETVAVDGLLQPTTYFKEIAAAAKADYLLLVGKDGVAVDDVQLDAMASTMPADAVMGYSHYRKKVDGDIVDAPTIDLQAGSLRWRGMW